ncbi:hypothetical protein GF318_03310 [Candidatus Micrarchaeota archaeon]|nr:hypothetical protein [Candidatus Micrarchaeota archaeon]
MIPESRLIQSELTIRGLTLPDDVLLARKSLLRWVALSLGMVSPNESRTLLLDILDVLFEFSAKNESPTTRDILARLEQKTKKGPNPKAVYYHLQKLKDNGIISRKKGRYVLGDGEESSLKEIFRKTYLRKTENAFSRIGKALDKLENGYKKV